MLFEAGNLKKDAAIREKGGVNVKDIQLGMYRCDRENCAIMVGQALKSINEEE